jgi:hypothetical protein
MSHVKVCDRCERQEPTGCKDWFHTIHFADNANAGHAANTRDLDLCLDCGKLFETWLDAPSVEKARGETGE